MAHHKSAWKRHLQSQKRRLQNRAKMSAMKTQLKRARAAISAGTAEPNGGDVQLAVKALARIGQKGLLHKKTAQRRISRLMKAANAKAAS